MPATTGFAFVVVQHLDPTHESLMAKLLAQATSMSVSQVQDGMRIRPNEVYVIPPNHNLYIERNRLRLTDPPAQRYHRYPIDFFFQSLARTKQNRAVALVLSGTGTDGTQGAKAIQEAGGLVLVQDPTTALHPGMPQSVMDAGAADLVLKVTDMPEALLTFLRRRPAAAAGALEPEATPALNGILEEIRLRHSHDFRSYKKSTLLRRLDRRMSLHGLSTLQEYLELAQREPTELDRLVDDLMIGVTSFFRESEAFDTLQREVVPYLARAAAEDRTIRVWVPGCSTGEEAYSLAILLNEQLDQDKLDKCKVQLFATDIDENALETARAGLYSARAVQAIPAPLLRKYFVQQGEHYQVSKRIRECVLFAMQNLVTHPPFSRLELISCRNLLIYLDPLVQNKVISLFHFSLNPEGFLFLGNSETIGKNTDLFEPVSKKWRIFRKKGISRQEVAFPIMGRRFAAHDDSREATPHPLHSFRDITQQALVREFAPASVLINRQFEAVYFHGNISRFVQVPAGEPTRHILQLVHPHFQQKLRSSIYRAINTQQPVTAAVLATEEADERQHIRLRITPTHQQGEVWYLISFLPPTEELSLVTTEADETDSNLLQQLELELKLTREDLQSTIEELETANEELKASNEEVMSMNEELQSSNEELETSKEELQSLNEELGTINHQLETKLDELEKTNNDLANLLNATRIATIFLSQDLTIRRFTPATSQLLSLIPTDVGRPLADIALKFEDPALLEDAREVLRTHKPQQHDIITSDQRWFSRTILPYRTLDHQVEGVVITFVDITHLKEMNARLYASERHWRSLVNNTPDVISRFDRQLRRIFINESFKHVAAMTENEVLYKHIRETPSPDEQERIRLAEEVENVFTTGKPHDFYSTVPTATAEQAHYYTKLVPEFDTHGAVETVLAISRDVTLLRTHEKVIEQSLKEKEALLAEIHHRVKNNLAVISGLLFLQSRTTQDESVRRMFEASRNRVQSMALLHEKLYRNESFSSIALQDYVEELTQQVKRSHLTPPTKVEETIRMGHLRFDMDTALTCGLLLNELLSNAYKHAFQGRTQGHIRVEALGDNGTISLHVHDDGTGFDAAQHPGRLGFRLINTLVAQLNGSLSVEQQKGTLVSITFHYPASHEPTAAQKDTASGR